MQKRSWDYQNFSKWNSKFWITVYKGRPQEDEVFGLPGGNYPKEMGHQSRNLFQYGSGIKHSKKFSSLKDDIHSTSSSSKPTVVTDLGMYNWWFTFFLWCQYCAVPSSPVVGSFYETETEIWEGSGQLASWQVGKLASLEFMNKYIVLFNYFEYYLV